MTIKKILPAVLLTVVLACLLCAGLYQFDNKYTHSGVQPVSGVLIYPRETEITWLTRQWEVFPDVLLSPETASDYDSYRYYGDIGDTGHQWQNSVTYRLNLLLPDEEITYALELPEIFSSYRCYVGGKLLAEMGDPRPETYQEALRNRIISFTAAGRTEIMLAVSDFSGVNRGLTYPPAFGTAEKVAQTREVRMVLHCGMVLLALLGSLLSLTFFCRENLWRGLTAGLMFLCLGVICGYPLYHGLLTTGLQPWYTLEPLCYYCLLLTALVLEIMIYELPACRALILALPGTLGILAVLVRFGFSGLLPQEAALAFSALAALLKYYTAFCLLGLSLWAVSRQKVHSRLLLCGGLALAVCLVFDRLLPLFEPVYGGWYGELGGLLMVLTVGSAIWLDATEAYRFRLTYQSSLHQMEQRLALQKEHYNQLSHQVRLAREAGHDLRHHMRTMNAMAQKKQWDDLTHYLGEYEPHIKERDLTIWSDHPAADAVLSYYAAEARKIGAVYNVRFAVPPDLNFPEDELCILLANLLENAMDAMNSQQTQTRKLYLRGEVADGHLGIVADNTFSGPLNVKGGVLLSTKGIEALRCGLGISSVTSIVEKYGGLADFSGEDGVFHVSLLIPLHSL